MSKEDEQRGRRGTLGCVFARFSKSFSTEDPLINVSGYAMRITLANDSGCAEMTNLIYKVVYNLY